MNSKPPMDRKVWLAIAIGLLIVLPLWWLAVTWLLAL